MSTLWAKLKRRKLVQWALAYLAGAFALLQGVDIVATRFDWPGGIERGLIVALSVGFFAALVVAWYHGERGEQRVTGMEIILLAVLLGIGGGLLWQFSRMPETTARRHESDAGAAAGTHAPSAATSARQAESPATIPAKSIAVLPFENLNVDKQDAYFVAGIQDLILTKLADIGDLKVISRTSTARYASRPDDLKTVGLQLGVATVLEGSVQKAGNEVLVNVQLIDTGTDSHIWAQAYTRTLDNVFGVEGEVAGKIADALKSKLSPAETKRLATALSSNPTANDLYLRGEYFANRGDVNYDTSAWTQALTPYRQAIAKMPDFALARARLSIAESFLAWFGGGGQKVATLLDDARAQAKQALELAPDPADAHVAMGYYDYYGKGDYTAALEAFSAALALRPNDSGALAARAFVLRRLGRFDEAVDALKRVSVLDPRDVRGPFQIGSTYSMLYRFADAEYAFQHALALDPGNVNVKRFLATAIQLGDGDLTRALAVIQGDEEGLKVKRVELLTCARRYSEALNLLQSVPDTPKNFVIFSNVGPKSLQLADLYRLNGDPAKAREFYAKALSEARAQFATLAGTPNQAFVLRFIAQAELGLGQTEEGLADAARLESIAEHSEDRLFGPVQMAFAAMLYARADRAEKAVSLITRALAVPGTGENYSPVMPWLDPAWEPIRKSPAFQALLKKYADRKPASVPAEAGGG